MDERKNSTLGFDTIIASKQGCRCFVWAKANRKSDFMKRMRLALLLPFVRWADKDEQYRGGSNPVDGKIIGSYGGLCRFNNMLFGFFSHVPSTVI